MQIHLVQLPTSVEGIYPFPKMPERMRRLSPNAAKSFMQLMENGYPIIVSDMFRTAESSLIARSQKSGVQRPGFSAHNFGESIDVDLTRTLERLKMSKSQFDKFMEKNGWFCHRKDSLNKSEAWHYNALLDNADKYLKYESSSRAPCIEAMLRDLYNTAFDMTPEEIQIGLQKLKLYNGDIDGKLGPRSKEAISAFQRAWKLTDPIGMANYQTQRTLSLITADFIITNYEK